MPNDILYDETLITKSFQVEIITSLRDIVNYIEKTI